MFKIFKFWGEPDFLDQSNRDIAIEIFANKIRTNTNINGLKIKKDLQSKISMYADDTQ